jgi:DNA-binding NtrC family response regulator
MSNAICELNGPTMNYPRQPMAGDEAPGGVAMNLLLIDGNPPRMSEHLRRAFPAPGYRVRVADCGAAGLQHIHCDSHDVVVVCPGSGTASELEIYRQVRRLDADVPVILVAGAGRADTAIEAMKQGAYDFLFQPVEPPVLRRVVDEALDVSRRRRQPGMGVTTDVETDSQCMLVGTSPAMQEVYKAIGRVAAQNVPVLITGESGTGKELVAQAIRQYGPRADAPFLALNCAAIPEPLLESELFGHEKGAFTGADRRRVGKFEQSDGGTIFLDEVGDMPLTLQAKMLRLLQEQTFERVGGSETVKTDVRLIAATHRDLKGWSEQGKFRSDLFYRLGVFTIHLPPLRERCEDLPVLVRHFLLRFNRELNRDIREISAEAMERLCSYSWPGNVRELQSVLKQALLRASGALLLPAFLPDLAPGQGSQAAAAGAVGGDDFAGRVAVRGAAPADEWSAFMDFIRRRLEAGSTDLSTESQLEIDRVLLPAVLRFTNNNQHQAAKILGLARQTLRLRLRSIGLSVVKTFGEDKSADL